MPQQQIITTWFALNGSNDLSPSGIANIRTGEPLFVAGLNIGDYTDYTEQEANEHSYISPPTLAVTIPVPLPANPLGTIQLHNGRYRRVRIEAAATQANLVTGRVAYMSATIPINDRDAVNTIT